MSEQIITLDDLVTRDQQESVEAWLLMKCEEAIKAGKIKTGWDGTSVEGEPVYAFVNNGRWLARCKVCGNPVYVSPQTPIFYCPECGNGGSGSAWGVQFPDERESIEAALLKRPVELVKSKRMIRNDVERAFNERPVVSGLTRNWLPGKSLDELRAENAEALNK